jgi:ABC-type antimicrobial peptide transport system permease subunit
MRTAVYALQRNVVRSFLTCMGIIIGVAAVVTMMEIGRGSASRIHDMIAKMGADNIIVWPGTAHIGGVSQGMGSVVTLHPQDREAILRECTAIRAAAPLVKTNPQLIYGNRNWSPSNTNGTTPEYLDIHNWPIAYGTMFSDQDVRSSSRVCVLGQTVVQELFDTENPIGKRIRLNNLSFKVVGVLAKKGANMTGWDQDDTLLTPWTTIKFRVSGKGGANTAANGASSVAAAAADQINTLSQVYPTQSVALYPQPSSQQQADTPQPIKFANIDQILLAARGEKQVPLAMRQIRQLLRERHRLGPGQPDDFNMHELTEFAQMMSSMSANMTILLTSVATLSLLVGGVGIMNIMLVSVTERTREIGLRMAVGARARDILNQFLIEAIMLCLGGGAIGIVLGRAASIFLRRTMGWRTEISVPAIIAAVVVSSLVGVVFGFYPAWKASRLDPIEALRYE